tara:strand:- start:1229 stop:1675 length:447 start_codon:yes stop_codon:yes gene_type:complete
MKYVGKIHNAAGIVPFKNDGEIKFLLIKNDLGWEFPKGHIEEGETKIQTAKRELEEETGLLWFKIIPSFKFISKYLITKNYATGEELVEPEPKIVTYFIAKVFSHKDKVKLSEEHHSYGWFSLEEANKKLYRTKKLEVLQYAARQIKG